MAPYAMLVPHIAWPHTLCQYRTSHGPIRYVSTAHRMAPYAMFVPHIAWPHTLCLYRALQSAARPTLGRARVELG
eukprot:3941947-Rhodomonas_salina.6